MLKQDREVCIRWRLCEKDTCITNRTQVLNGLTGTRSVYRESVMGGEETYFTNEHKYFMAWPAPESSTEQVNTSRRSCTPAAYGRPRHTASSGFLTPTPKCAEAIPHQVSKCVCVRKKERKPLKSGVPHACSKCLSFRGAAQCVATSVRFS
jgi:hypothetical protein